MQKYIGYVIKFNFLIKCLCKLWGRKSFIAYENTQLTIVQLWSEGIQIHALECCISSVAIETNVYIVSLLLGDGCNVQLPVLLE